jgi:plasmid stabilization system protein ParE
MSMSFMRTWNRSKFVLADNSSIAFGKHWESMPHLYGVIERDIRAARLRKFRHVVYYVVFQDRVEVLAVLHGARDPSVWRGRR